MANVTIPNLTSATTIAPSTDLMVLEQTNGTRKAKLSQIFTSSATSGSGLGITSGGVYTIKSGLDSDISDINTLLGNTSIASIGDGTVTGAVSQINSDLTPTSISLTCGYDIKEVYGKKVKNQIKIDFLVRNNSGFLSTSWSIIITIDNPSYRPTSTIYFPVSFTNSDRTSVIDFGIGKIDTNGRLYVMPKNTTPAYSEVCGVIEFWI